MSKAFIEKELVLTELKKLREEVMFNSMQYQVIVKAIDRVSELPEAFVDLEDDDLK